MRNDLALQLKRRVLTLDGAMATMILGRYPCGCVDALTLTASHVVLDLHRAYVNAGADIIRTNTFNANAISLEKHGLDSRVYELNYAAARIAREAAGRNRYVAGCIGPGCVSLSQGDARFSCADMTHACIEQARALIQGGVDVLLIETVFDIVNADALLKACRRAMSECAVEIPLMVSATLNLNGCLPSGATLAQFVALARQADPLSIGLNCGYGIEHMLPYVGQLQNCGCFISLHANAGIPDSCGRYPQSPCTMAFSVKKLLQTGQLNILGGCCGTTPDHIRAIAVEATRAIPHRPQSPS